MNEIIENFKEETGYTLIIKNGELFYDGNIDLSGSEITQLPDNLTVNGELILRNTDIKDLPNNLTVGDYLELWNTRIESIPDNLIVGGSLYLNDTGIKSLPKNLTVGGYLDLSNTRIKSLPDNLTVGDSLDLRGTGVTSLPDSLTVGGVLDIRDTRITDNVEVNTTLSPEQQKKIHDLENMALFWERNGVRYIKADGIFSVIDSHHGNAYKVHALGQEDNPLYLITDGEGHWSHGATLEEAKADLIYKINDRDTSEYEKLSLDDTLSYEEAIAAYRSITGACSAGTIDFIENRLPTPHKDKYTIREIIKLTKNEYGGKTFAQFFE